MARSRFVAEQPASVSRCSSVLISSVLSCAGSTSAARPGAKPATHRRASDAAIAARLRQQLSRAFAIAPCAERQCQTCRKTMLPCPQRQELEARISFQTDDCFLVLPARFIGPILRSAWGRLDPLANPLANDRYLDIALAVSSDALFTSPP